jgi:hypothetical protein
MGGPSAPGDLQEGCETQAWLAAGDDTRADVSGRYFYRQEERKFNPEAGDLAKQDAFMAICGEISGVPFPEEP